MSSTAEQLKRTIKAEKAPTIYRHVIVTKKGSDGALYGLGVIGAAVYYMQHALTFRARMIGFFKALVWPALLLYRVLTILKM